MIETQLDLQANVTGTFGADGTVLAFLGPGSPWERWAITRYTTSSSSTGCKLSMYRNYVSDGTYLDSTLKGSNDTGGIQAPLLPGEKLALLWANGSVGMTVLFVAYGSRFIRGDRGYGR